MYRAVTNLSNGVPATAIRWRKQAFSFYAGVNLNRNENEMTIYLWIINC